MSKTQLMTNEEVLKLAGVTDAEITQLKTLDITTAVNTLDPIFNKLMSIISAQRTDWANLNNPLSITERSYNYLNDGAGNYGFFQENLIPARPIGSNNLYGGKEYIPPTKGKPLNPWESQDFGADPIQYVFGINAKIERTLNYDRYDLLMAFRQYSLDSFLQGKVATLEAENNGSRYIIENRVLNVENFQYVDYASAPVWKEADALDRFIQHTMAMQNFPEANMEYKRTKFNTTRRDGQFLIILENDFWYEYAQKYQIKNFMSPIVFRTNAGNGSETEIERSRVITLDKLTPTTLNVSGKQKILDPLNVNDATLPANTKLIGRIVDMNAIKFGMGEFNTTAFPLGARTSYYDEVQDYCFNMSDAYTNIPLLINTNTFTFDRKFHVVSETATTPTALKV